MTATDPTTLDAQHAALFTRVAAVLADLDQIMPEKHNCTDYSNECWPWHAGCLAARIRRTLTGEDPTDGR